ncbi:disintegrin and metalloproteinase domain-containing protein 10 precursor [Saccoglossus kowalevskii]|uniref:ADAM10 endopeptidase n=1 Tax=Saccoglossus kowalevskii TaxID=10224 RepID=D1LWV5_SACKO|nr:disintegrin and metalloproteinase domain-containing protein 10 precursor [Saccoglossus kowalevskii]ACY92461.1 ADAM10 metallopeptidase [Saccoglossus kowalevskii]
MARGILAVTLMLTALSYASDHPALMSTKHLKQFQFLKYDRTDLHERHLRAKRSADSRVESHKTVELKFSAYNRDFHLRLKRDTVLFHPDFVLESSSHGVINYDTSHFYTGKLKDEPSSHIHGSILDGLFEGKVYTGRHQYYIEPASLYGEESKEFHSIIYEDDDVDYPHKYGHGCGLKDSTANWMKEIQKSGIDDYKQGVSSLSAEDEHHHQEYNKYSESFNRKKRATDDKNTCTLYIQADHLYTAAFLNQDQVVSQIASHVSAANAIYQKVYFGDYVGISFVVARIKINDTEDANDPSNPFASSNIGVEKFLELNSEQNHDPYCLAYIFTDRDFDDGVLGLAWVASPSGASGGICERYKMYAGGARKSLNTGIITIQNYGSRVPTKVSHITFAHEMGHNFGSPHDYPLTCRPGDNTDENIAEKGNYIMYARATSGDKPNNNKFSECSKGNMTNVLKVKKDICFVSSDVQFCGNGIIDGDDEECDCGFEDQCEDICCIPQTENGDDNACKKKSGKVCSPSQGPCCSSACEFIPEAENVTCNLATDCNSASFCDGSGSKCPDAELKPNRTECNDNRQICYLGECSGSICEAADVMMEECFCSGEEKTPEEKCHLCCQEPGQPDTCESSANIEALIKYYPEGQDYITMQPGAACDNFQGYCDVLDKCRLVDADGPLARLKNAIFNPEVYQDIADWVTTYWWAVVLMGVGLIIVMGLFIKICSVATPSSNPKLPPARTLSRKNRTNQTRAMELQ